MRKDEKEVLQYQLDSEKAILKELEKQYKAALEAIDEKVAALLGRSDANLQHVIFQIEHQKALRRQIEGVLNQLHSNEFDTISDYLANCYEDGFIGSMYSMHHQGIPVIVPIDQNEVTKAVVLDSKISEGLYESIGVDVDKMKKSIRSEITRGISAGMSYNEIARNISKATKAPLSRAKTIVATEGHRVQQASNYDGQRKAKSKGADVVKQWNSILDGNTRPTHRKLDGQIREVEEPFEMDGKKAMYPGEFGDPAEDCNCRCVSMTRARWALDEDELQTLKDRAEYFGLDKSESFADFKKKYLQSLENPGKSGTIDVEIDEFVPCLRDVRTGEIVDTVVREVTDRSILKEYTEKSGWYINWKSVPKDCRICALQLKGDDAFQGLVAFKAEEKNMATYAHWVVAAPHNRGANKEYSGVGAHLFAIMAEESVNAGFGGFMYGKAANQEVMKHYIDTLGAVHIGDLRFFIDEEAAQKLLDEYTFEWVK